MKLTDDLMQFGPDRRDPSKKKAFERFSDTDSDDISSSDTESEERFSELSDRPGSPETRKNY